MALTINPLSESNGVVAILRGTDLGLATADFTIGANLLKNFVVKPPVPMKVRVIIKLASGDVDVNIDVNSTGTYASADSTLAVAGTTEVCLTVVTTEANPYACIQLDTDATGCVVEALEVDVLGLMPANWDWHSVRTGMNALVPTGTGNYTADSND